MSEPTTRQLFAYLEGDVTPSEAAAIARHVRDSAATNSRIQDLEAIAARIRERDERLDEIDLVDAVRGALATSPPPAAVRRRWRLPLAAGVVAAAAALVLVFLRPAAHDDGVRDKGGGAVTADRWLALTIYQVGPQGEPRRVEGRITARWPLAFSYTNLGPAPMPYLMVVGVDAQGGRNWYFPEAGAAIPARAGEGVELPEQIAFDLPPGPLVIYAIFAQRPLRVGDVEAFLGRPPPPGVIVLATHLEVTP